MVGPRARTERPLEDLPAGGLRVEEAHRARVHGPAGVDDRSSVVVMSHNYLRDRDFLRALLGSEAAYIGMLGPRARTERLLDDLAAEGLRVEDAHRARIHGPAGLDIGAEGPDEIAAA